ncbi:hypothetical protein FRC96_05360 [Lujinxingia vulgaris]|uniref:Uncharacterized protein n=1 Tax=Lujinxingia vulgaris TaxID=2600176 RepID=A0A5C6XNK2_9DELT|nr:hypothetical protein [Lujinxingia vulgaris]TXD40674.1 hypothetical protein FRC96_05360 [Lujinxingia vulgaris]
MSDNQRTNPFNRENPTDTRLDDLSTRGFLVVVTRAFGPTGEDIIAHDGPRFSGEPGVKIRVKQGDLEEDVILSPFYGDSSKISSEPFEVGKPCELFCPVSGKPLDRIPGMATDDGGDFYAVYLTEKLGRGELVAVNNIWGNANSQMMSEDEMLLRLADAQDEASS